MRRNSYVTRWGTLSAMAGLLVLAACGDDATQTSDAASDDNGVGSGFTGDGGNDSAGDDNGTGTDGGGPGGDGNPNTDDGDPDPPGEGAELCDAGDEAWVKRIIPFVQSRKPASIREVRLLVSMIEQLDAMNQPGRLIVARGLSRGDLYLDVWKTYLFEKLKINRAGDRRNELCYDIAGPESNTPDLAAFIRDNTAEARWDGDPFAMRDVVYSTLLLDDMSPLYRADMFARMSAPLIAGNVNQAELEAMRRSNYGGNFETNYLGRFHECVRCHRYEFSVVDDVDPDLDRHWPIAGTLETAVYGPDAAEPDPFRAHAIFRHNNFAASYAQFLNDSIPEGALTAWGWEPTCGLFAMGNPGNDALDIAPYMISDFADEFPPNGSGATTYELDQHLKRGFDELRANGLSVASDNSVDSDSAGAYLFAMNFTNHLWEEAMGFPLITANGFSRNPDQQELLETGANSFVASSFSLRQAIADVATHEYFNQAPPADCGATTPYHMPAIFDPFTKSSTDPAARGNGVGDSVHRYRAWVLLDQVSQAMWWPRADRFGPDQGLIPGAGFAIEGGCGGNMPNTPCIEAPENETVLRDLGAFLSDSEAGFNGTDIVTLLRLENDFADGFDPGLEGVCTGPLGGACPDQDWIEQLVALAGTTAGSDLWDVASAVKDRLINEPRITDSEANIIATLMGVDDLSNTVSDIGLVGTENAARLFAGMLISTPQFMLAGVAPADQDVADDPTLIVPGTTTQELCDYIAPFILDNTEDGYEFSYTCGADGIELGG